MYSNKVKDYDSIEETQKIKGSNDIESDERINSGSKKNFKVLGIIIFILFLFFGLIFFLFIKILNKQKSQINNPVYQQVQQNPQISQNLTNEQKELNQSIQQSENKNSSPNDLKVIMGEILNRTFDIRSKKRNHTNISIPELLPKIKRKSVKNITEILKSKTLNIKDKKITNEYIQFIKPLNETIETKYKKILFPDLIFDNYSFDHVHNYSMYLSYLNKASHKNDKKKKDNYKVNKTKILNKLKANITKNNSITHNIGVNNLTNQSLSNSINSIINQTLNNTINMVNNQNLSNAVNSVNNQTLNNHINSINNQTLNNPNNIANNQSISNTINNSSNLTNQFNNSKLNTTHGLRNLELSNSNSKYLIEKSL